MGLACARRSPLLLPMRLYLHDRLEAASCPQAQSRAVGDRTSSGEPSIEGLGKAAIKRLRLFASSN